MKKFYKVKYFDANGLESWKYCEAFNESHLYEIFSKENKSVISFEDMEHQPKEILTEED